MCIRDRYDIVAQYVDLKKRGRNYFGLCPFHSEKTPSFSVAPDKQIYHCFGCGAGGNVFSFIIEHQKISFIEAVQQLGHKYGIHVENKSGPANKIFSSLYEVHDIAVKLYHDILFSEKGKLIAASNALKLFTLLAGTVTQGGLLPPHPNLR